MRLVLVVFMYRMDRTRSIIPMKRSISVAVQQSRSIAGLGEVGEDQRSILYSDITRVNSQIPPEDVLLLPKLPPLPVLPLSN